MALLGEACARAAGGERVVFVVHRAAFFGHLRHLLSVAEWARDDWTVRHDRVLMPSGGEVTFVPKGNGDRLVGVPRERQVWDHYARGWA